MRSFLNMIAILRHKLDSLIIYVVRDDLLRLTRIKIKLGPYCVKNIPNHEKFGFRKFQKCKLFH